MSSHFIQVITVISLFQIYFCAKSTDLIWSVEDENVVCSLANQNLVFCDAKGAADEDCTNIAEKVEGTKPTCSDINVCSFIKDGTPAYVTCASRKKGYRVLRNCMNEWGTVQPDTKEDLSNRNTLKRIIGKDDKGVYEKPNIKPRVLCTLTDAQTVSNCQSTVLRNAIIKNFHPDRRLGNLCGGFCSIIGDTEEETGERYEVNRCVMEGTFYDAKSGERDRFRLHLFNHGKDPAVAIMGYWGNDSLREPTKH